MHSTDGAPLTELAQKCREESERYRRGRSDERGHCYELFRRAIVDHDQQAWAAVYEQYRRLVARWVTGSPGPVDDRIHEAFERFLRTVNPQTFTTDFSGIDKVMACLKMCARSVSIDQYRRDEKRAFVVALEDVTTKTGDSTDSQALDNVMLEELFSYIEGRLKDEQERLVFYASFRDGLMPRMIAAEYPDHFADVAQVRRIKEKVVLRLSTDPRLQAWWKG